MTATEMLRQKILNDIVSKMSDEERREYLLLSSISREHNDVIAIIKEQGENIDVIKRKQSWLSDFSANITANATWDALVFIGSRLISKL